MANGQDTMNQPAKSVIALRQIAAGLSARLAREAEGQGLTRDDVRMIIPDRTRDRRIASNEPLKLDEADGIARLLRVVTMARRMFGDDALADEWLRSANPAVDGDIPIRLARCDLGGREVEAVPGRIEHGVFGWSGSGFHENKDIGKRVRAKREAAVSDSVQT